jgi:hypothetical protein
MENETEKAAATPYRWGDVGSWVRAFTAPYPNATYAIGRVFSYCDVPTLGIETIEGQRIHWRADLAEPTERPTALPKGNRNVVDNALSGTLTQQYGFLPLDVRYGAAEAARSVVEAWIAGHDDWLKAAIGGEEGDAQPVGDAA